MQVQDLVTKKEKAVYTVKISEDGKDEYNYMNVTFDVNAWRVIKEDDSVANYPLGGSSDNSDSSTVE